MKLEKVHAVHYQGSQSVGYKALYQLGGQRLEIDIKRDTYLEQSHAIVRVYSQQHNEWKYLASIPPVLMKSDRKFVSGNLWAINEYKEDEEELLKIAELIL